MLDYCLLSCLFHNDIQSYQIFGETNLHPKVKQLIEYKNIKLDSNADLIYINNESHGFIQYFLKNNLPENIKLV